MKTRSHGGESNGPRTKPGGARRVMRSNTCLRCLAVHPAPIAFLRDRHSRKGAKGRRDHVTSRASQNAGDEGGGEGAREKRVRQNGAIHDCAVIR